MNMPADEICPGKPASKIPKYITVENLATVVPICLLSVVFMYVVTYAYDWPNADDFDSVRLYEKWFTHGHYEVFKVLQEHNQMHPLGFLYLMTFIVFKLFGVHPVAVIWLNSAIIFGAATILSVYSRTLFNHKIIKAILPALIFAFSFHPIQAGHLIWAFEVGWFFINAAAVCNVVLVERFGGRAIGLVLLLLAFASMSSAHGCVLWLSAALHVSLIPHYRRRLLTIGVLITGFTINLLAIFSFMPQTGITHKIASIKFGLYCLALLGAEFGVRDEPVLVACGAVVAVACIWVVWRLLRAPKTAALRMAVVLISASAGFLLLFAAGRYQYGLPWALAAFHMGPLLIPVLLGLLLALADAFDGAATRSRGRLAACALLLAFLMLSVGRAMPYALARGQLNLTKEGLAKHVACSPGYSRYVIAAANIGDGYYDLVALDRPALQHLCVQPEPARVQVLARPPVLFEALIAKRPELHDTLVKVWELYITHLDLVIAFPPEDPDAAKKLLQWAKFAAAQRDGYDGLAPLSPVLQTIDLAAIPPAQGAP